MTSEEFKRAQAVANTILKAAEQDGQALRACDLLDRWLDLQRKLTEARLAAEL
jgi:hypothetical protein